MRTFVIGDIHAEYDKLEQILYLCNFDFENDKLITLGDIVDRGEDWVRCVDILFKVKNRIDIRGNHDAVFLHYIQTGVDMFQGEYGSLRTIEQYEALDSKMIYESFFIKQIPYYIDDKNRCFVHGGFDRNYKLIDNVVDDLYWDRKLLFSSLSCAPEQILKIRDDFSEIYVGHTPTLCYGKKDINPTFSGNLIWNLDTGCGKGGVLTIMDIETKEYWQSK